MIEINGLDKHELINHLSSYGIELNEERFNYLIFSLELITTEDEFSTRTKFPKMPSGMIGMMVPQTNYYLNTRRATLILALALVDALIASGIASAAFAISGRATKSFVKLEPKSGEFCLTANICKMHEEKVKITPKKVSKRLKGETCPFLKAECKYEQDQICSLKTKNARKVFHSLEGKEVLILDEEQWKLNKTI